MLRVVNPVEQIVQIVKPFRAQIEHIDSRREVE